MSLILHQGFRLRGLRIEHTDCLPVVVSCRQLAVYGGDVADLRSGVDRNADVVVLIGRLVDDMVVAVSCIHSEPCTACKGVGRSEHRLDRRTCTLLHHEGGADIRSNARYASAYVQRRRIVELRVLYAFRSQPVETGHLRLEVDGLRVRAEVCVYGKVVLTVLRIKDVLAVTCSLRSPTHRIVVPVDRTQRLVAVQVLERCDHRLFRSERRRKVHLVGTQRQADRICISDRQLVDRHVDLRASGAVVVVDTEDCSSRERLKDFIIGGHTQCGVDSGRQDCRVRIKLVHTAFGPYLLLCRK